MECIELLIKSGANVNLQGFDGVPAIVMAAFNNQVESIELLLNAGALIDLPVNAGYTALMIAASGRVNSLKVLINAGANLNYRDVEDKASPIMLAASEGHIDCLQLLIEAGADINIQHVNEITPTMITAQRGHVTCLYLLIEAGANIELKNSDNKTALDLAIESQSFSCIQLLESTQIWSRKKSFLMALYGCKFRCNDSKNNKEITDTTIKNNNSPPSIVSLSSPSPCRPNHSPLFRVLNNNDLTRFLSEYL